MLHDLIKRVLMLPIAALEALLVMPLLAPSLARKARLAWRRRFGKANHP